MVGYSEYFNRLYFQSTYVKVGFSGWLRVGYSEYFEQLYFQSTYEYNLTLPFIFVQFARRQPEPNVPFPDNGGVDEIQAY